jgi:hypothetical protein
MLHRFAITQCENLGNHDPDTSFLPSSDHNLNRAIDGEITVKNFHNESVQLGQYN